MNEIRGLVFDEFHAYRPKRSELVEKFAPVALEIVYDQLKRSPIKDEVNVAIYQDAAIMAGYLADAVLAENRRYEQQLLNKESNDEL